MFDPSATVVTAFEEEMVRSYLRAFPDPVAAHVGTLRELARSVLALLAGTDAPYHDLSHTLLVTEVGQEILASRRMAEGGVSSTDWLNFVASTLCHDIGYVRGVCQADRGGAYDPGSDGAPLHPPPGATDAWMTPWHVDRGQRFVHERFRDHPVLDPVVIARNIEHTRFPVPPGAQHAATGDLPGLCRAADLIGQLADPLYLRKTSKLYAEFRETGEAERLGYADAADLRAGYPGFFWNVVRRYIDDGLRHLQRTGEGRIWAASLYAHVLVEEHAEPAFGPERRAAAGVPASAATRVDRRRPAVRSERPAPMAVPRWHAPIVND